MPDFWTEDLYFGDNMGGLEPAFRREDTTMMDLPSNDLARRSFSDTWPCSNTEKIHKSQGDGVDNLDFGEEALNTNNRIGACLGFGRC